MNLNLKGKQILTMHSETFAVSVSMHFINVVKYRSQHVLIPSEIPTIEQLGMPAVLYDLANKPQGLILVTGPRVLGNRRHLQQ